MDHAMDAELSGTLREAHHVALQAVGRSRQVLHQRAAAEFRTEEKGPAGDVVTDIDYASEHQMIKIIHDAFPDHRISSEEGGGVDGPAEWTWLIDPLDGTNNVVLGIPLFGSCVTLCHRGAPVVAAIYAAHEDATYSAIRGHGALRNGIPVRIRHEGPPEHATVSWISGYAVRPDDIGASQALELLDRRFKRTLNLWAPSVDWSLLVRGRTAALLAYKNEPEDLLCGVLIAAEAGAVVTDFAGCQVTDLGAAERLVVAAPDIASYLTKVLAELDGVGGPG
ncbi:MAG: inositol monophosphatase family protein [Streptosporangiaceae bacterium]